MNLEELKYIFNKYNNLSKDSDVLFKTLPKELIKNLKRVKEIKEQYYKINEEAQELFKELPKVFFEKSKNDKIRALLFYSHYEYDDEGGYSSYFDEDVKIGFKKELLDSLNINYSDDIYTRDTKNDTIFIDYSYLLEEDKYINHKLFTEEDSNILSDIWGAMDDLFNFVKLDYQQYETNRIYITRDDL